MTTAIYARYSTNLQRATSIDDQVRRCREVVLRYGLAVVDCLIFSDSALSGTKKHIDKREGFKALLNAWDEHRFSTLIVDEFSRLSRDGPQQAQLIERLSESPVRLITADGIDTAVPNWQLVAGMQGLAACRA